LSPVNNDDDDDNDFSDSDADTTFHDLYIKHHDDYFVAINNSSDGNADGTSPSYDCRRWCAAVCRFLTLTPVSAAPADAYITASTSTPLHMPSLSATVSPKASAVVGTGGCGVAGAVVDGFYDTMTTTRQSLHRLWRRRRRRLHSAALTLPVALPSPAMAAMPAAALCRLANTALCAASKWN
jgi:hypothetical protein